MLTAIARLLQAPGERPRRELRSLVGVEDLRPAHRQGLVQRLQAERPSSVFDSRHEST